jgi:hypothetical protein
MKPKVLRELIISLGFETEDRTSYLAALMMNSEGVRVLPRDEGRTQ